MLSKFIFHFWNKTHVNITFKINFKNTNKNGNFKKPSSPSVIFGQQRSSQVAIKIIKESLKSLSKFTCLKYTKSKVMCK